MKPSIADRVEHIIEAVENINKILKGLDFPQL